jgi:prepilin peptidase CpaA
VSALPQLLAVCSSLLAIACDLRTRRIPNRLTASTAVLGLSLNLAVACTRQPGLTCTPAAIGSPLAGGALLLVCAGVLSALGMLGFGDSKLLAAIGLCVGLPLALRVLVCVVLSGGVVALGYMLGGGHGRAVWRNLRRIPELRAQRVDEAPRDLHVFPYAVAIALGTGWAVAGAHVPALAIF